MPELSEMVGRINLKKTYPIVEAEEFRCEDWAGDLWGFVKVKVPFSVDLGSLREKALKDVLHERFVNYIFSRLVIGAVYVFNIAHKKSWSEKVIAEALSESIDVLLDIDEEIKHRIIWYLERIAKRVIRDEAMPSKGQNRSIRKFAAIKGHRCYLCGKDLHYKSRPYGSPGDNYIEIIRQKRTFEIEHVWNRARGGSRDRSNLAASCNECNQFKKHFLTFSDMPVEQVMTHTMDSRNISSAISREQRFSLVWCQQGKCSLCEINFHDLDDESLVLIKREESQPYHFFNMMLICLVCNNRFSRNGVILSA
ncbi:HNH endonuclease [Pseudomonas sp. NPDC088885]|uniref:HNH endonuclease n=1 Tax=Pseudomonas sp. NPDC088885 TaxID=3364457 RepID=UPI0038104FD7